MDTLPETNIFAPEIGPSPKEIHRPTIHFQGQVVSFRVGTPSLFSFVGHVSMAKTLDSLDTQLQISSPPVLMACPTTIRNRTKKQLSFHIQCLLHKQETKKHRDKCTLAGHVEVKLKNKQV